MKIFLIFALFLASLDLGPSLRDICAANRSDEKQVLNIGINMLSGIFTWILLIY